MEPMNGSRQTVPLHVAIIFTDAVRLHGDVEHLWQRLREAGYQSRLFIDDHGYPSIRFESGTSHPKNISLLTLLFLLNDLGVPFAEDHTQLLSPAALMLELQRGLVLRKPFCSIAAKSVSGNWASTVHEPSIQQNA